MHLASASLQQLDKIILSFDTAPSTLLPADITISPHVDVLSIEQLESIAVLHTAPLSLHRTYIVTVKRAGTMPVIPRGIFDGMTSAKPLGCVRENGHLVFRTFSPRAFEVELVLYHTLNDTLGTAFTMEKDKDGVWELSLPASDTEPWYCYRIHGPSGIGEMFDGRVAAADPYGRITAAKNTYRHEARTAVPLKESPPFDWKGDGYIAIDPSQLIIYECHVRDMTAHPSSGVSAEKRGSYAGFMEKGATGGLEYIKSLGVNAVEFLPLQHFSKIELPYLNSANGQYNTWNPYERNHWGYMTSFFFEPEPYYASGASLDRDKWLETGTRHIEEFKTLVRALHKKGIAVICDVVYNHTSQYDVQPFKYLDKQYYYRTDAHGGFTGLSGCGNDFASERPMARRLIVDSVEYWMKEFHVDGFRFDLGAMLDDDTLIAIRDKVRSIHSGAILIAEPWGGGQYDLGRFSRLGYQVWNDIFRNAVKGGDPGQGKGFIFGTWGWSSSDDYGKWVSGCSQALGGPLLESAHSVNYLESHDGYTLGDFIRIALGDSGPHAPVLDPERHHVLTSEQLRIHKLAALMLVSSQGAIMIHEGQEFGRSKVIAPMAIPGIPTGILDHNSYEKDDETNWLDYRHAEANKDLIEYYRGVFGIRNKYPALCAGPVHSFTFLHSHTAIASGYLLKDGAGKGHPLCVLINPNTKEDAVFTLPKGRWQVLADAVSASSEGLCLIEGETLTVPRGTGMILALEKPPKRTKTPAPVKEGKGKRV